MDVEIQNIFRVHRRSSFHEEIHFFKLRDDSPVHCARPPCSSRCNLVPDLWAFPKSNSVWKVFPTWKSDSLLEEALWGSRKVKQCYADRKRKKRNIKQNQEDSSRSRCSNNKLLRGASSDKKQFSRNTGCSSGEALWRHRFRELYRISRTRCHWKI